jgi:hypothetical protein
VSPRKDEIQTGLDLEDFAFTSQRLDNSIKIKMGSFNPIQSFKFVLFNY